MNFETIAAIVFLVLLTILVYLKRKNLETKHLIPNILYFSMYKTKLGLKFMDSAANKYKKFVLYAGYFGIFVGFLGMIFIAYSLVYNIYFLFTTPEAQPGVGLVLPVKAKGIFFVPFFYWIISIFVIAVVHEFSHGLVARAHNLKVKSSGFAFLGLVIPIIPAAFVEPDEKELRKRPPKEQLSVFAAGPLANIATAFVCLGIFLLIASIAVADGVKVTDYVRESGTFPAEKAGIKIGEVIKAIDGIETPYRDNLSNVLKTKNPGDVVTIKTDKSTYQLKLARNPENESTAYIGAFLEQNIKLRFNDNKFIVKVVVWLSGLFYFLLILNFGIGLFNLVPIGPLDGGRMIQLPLLRFFGKEKGNKAWAYIGMFFLIIILVNISFAFIR